MFPHRRQPNKGILEMAEGATYVCESAAMRNSVKEAGDEQLGGVSRDPIMFLNTLNED